MGLDTLSSPTEQESLSYSPFKHRTPILKRISQTYNNLLDSRRVAPVQPKTTPTLIPSTRFSSSSCQECHKKLSGKTVRLPDTETKYHWKCLKCKSCDLPFEDTSFFIDAKKFVFHPSVSNLYLNKLEGILTHIFF